MDRRREMDWRLEVLLAHHPGPVTTAPTEMPRRLLDVADVTIQFDIAGGTADFRRLNHQQDGHTSNGQRGCADNPGGPAANDDRFVGL